MKHSRFVHLHVHTEYSLLDGACRIDKLIEKAREYKMPALAITDHGNMFGAIEFYNKALAAGIKPIIGCELYLAHGSMTSKDKRSSEQPFHLTALAKDEAGYKNLIKLITLAHLEGFYYKPRVDMELLSSSCEGLIILSGCLKGELSRLILSNRYEKAVKVACGYRDMLGAGNYYIEIQDEALEEQKTLNPGLIRLARETGIPLVATNDCHYLNKEDAKYHDILLCIQTNTNIHDPKRMKFSTGNFFFRSPEEMGSLFSQAPEAISNSVEIAEKCNLELELGKVSLPSFPLPGGEEAAGFLQKLCEEGIKKRYGASAKAPMERLRHELEIIKSTGFESYFLIVWDFVNFAKGKKYAVGPGRGSAAGSIVSYALGITNIDPLKYGLIFERFLNAARRKLPDIDIDFSVEHRADVISYVRNKYGKERVAQIVTFGTMAARGAIRDVGRALGISYGEVDRIARLVPEELNITLEEAVNRQQELKNLSVQNEWVDELLKCARELEGTVRHASTHAAGVVISDRDLIQYVPVMKGSEEEIITQYSMNSLEAVGLLKMDFLGLKTLSIIQETVENIKKKHRVKLDIDNLPDNDSNTFNLLKEGRTSGVFQLESSGMKDLLRKIEPERIEDIIAVLALYRPGPLGSGMVNDFIKRKHNLVPVKYDHPLLEKTLKETCGVILYQEQIMKIASELAGFTLEQADDLQRAISKKVPGIMEQQQEIFVKGVAKRGTSKKVAEKVFELIAHFAGYGFNKAHSTAYAIIAYQTAYLKANYLREFYAAVLSNEMNNTEKLTGYINECRSLGLKVLPPDINASDAQFRVEGDDIRFGLGAVKNVGLFAIESIVKSRQEKGDFSSIFDFCERVDLRLVNKRVLESLIKCGAFDFTGINRSQMHKAADKAIAAGQQAQKDRKSGQISLFEAVSEEESFKSGNSHYPDEIEWPEAKLLASEKEVLGFYVSGHPLARYEELVRNYATTNAKAVKEVPEGEQAEIIGVVSSIKRVSTKKGHSMAYVRIEDLEGSVEAVFFSRKYEEYSELLKIDSVIYLKGKIDARQDEIKIIADTVIPASEIEARLSRSAHIKLVSTGLQPEDIETLKDMLLDYPGDCPVHIHCVDSHNREVVLGGNPILTINPKKEMVRRVRELLGEDAIYFRR